MMDGSIYGLQIEQQTSMIVERSLNNTSSPANGIIKYECIISLWIVHAVISTWQANTSNQFTEAVQ